MSTYYVYSLQNTFAYLADGTRLGTVVTDCGAGQGPAARLPVCKLGLDCRDEARTGPAGCICGCDEARPVEGGYYGCGDRVCSEAPQSPATTSHTLDPCMVSQWWLELKACRASTAAWIWTAVWRSASRYPPWPPTSAAVGRRESVSPARAAARPGSVSFSRQAVGQPSRNLWLFC